MPGAQPRPEAQKLRFKVRGHAASRFGAGGGTHRPRSILIEAVLIVLVVSTTWAIASVSAWWVPVYLTLLVMIFVTPRGRQPLSLASVSDVLCDVNDTSKPGSGPRVDHWMGADKPRPVSRPESDLGNSASELVGPSDLNPDLTVVSTAKLRRGRIRARKGAKPVTEPVLDPPPVAWIQVGPGKFVRVEGGNQFVDTAQIENVTERVESVTETFVGAVPAEAAEAGRLGEQESPESPEIFSGELGLNPVPDHSALGSVVEEHGIAPSAFHVNPQLNASVKRPHCDLPVRVDQSVSEPPILATPVDRSPPSEMDPERHFSRPGVSRTWVRRIQRRTNQRVPRAHQASWRRMIRTYPTLPTLNSSWFAANVTRQNAASRAFGRMAHVQRSLRSRSPPVR